MSMGLFQYFLIWLLGAFLSYQASRYTVIKIFKQTWTKQDRVSALFWSIFHYISFVIIICIAVSGYEDDEPASW